MTTSEFIVLGLRRSGKVLHQLIDDLRPEDWSHRPCEGGNTAGWILSHLIAIEHMVLTRLTGGRPPVDLPDPEFAKRYGKGAPDLGHSHLDPATLVPVFDTQRDRLIERVMALSADDLDEPVDHPTYKTVGELLSLVLMHAGLHAGQISTIRRTLGRPATM